MGYKIFLREKPWFKIGQKSVFYLALSQFHPVPANFFSKTLVMLISFIKKPSPLTTVDDWHWKDRKTSKNHEFSSFLPLKIFFVLRKSSDILKNALFIILKLSKKHWMTVYDARFAVAGLQPRRTTHLWYWSSLIHDGSRLKIWEALVWIKL